MSALKSDNLSCMAAMAAAALSNDDFHTMVTQTKTPVEKMTMEKKDGELVFEYHPEYCNFAESFYPNFIEVTGIPDYALKSFEIWLSETDRVCYIPFSIFFAFGKPMKHKNTLIIPLSDIVLGKYGSMSCIELLNASKVKYVVRCDDFSDVTLPPVLPPTEDDLKFYMELRDPSLKIYTQYTNYGKGKVEKSDGVVSFRSFQEMDLKVNDEGNCSIDLSETTRSYGDRVMTGIVIFSSAELKRVKMTFNGFTFFDLNDTLLFVKGTYPKSKLPTCSYKPMWFTSWQEKDNWYGNPKNQEWMAYLDSKFKNSEWEHVVYIPTDNHQNKLSYMGASSHTLINIDRVVHTVVEIETMKGSRVRVLPAFMDTVSYEGKTFAPCWYSSPWFDPVKMPTMP